MYGIKRPKKTLDREANDDLGASFAERARTSSYKLCEARFLLGFLTMAFRSTPTPRMTYANMRVWRYGRLGSRYPSAARSCKASKLSRNNSAEARQACQNVATPANVRRGAGVGVSWQLRCIQCMHIIIYNNYVYAYFGAITQHSSIRIFIYSVYFVRIFFCSRMMMDDVAQLEYIRAAQIKQRKYKSSSSRTG